MMHEAFIAAKRTEVDRLEALARDLLENHPPPNVWPKEGSAGEVVEIEWRELAHASRQLRPLLEALERANAREPGFESYRDGFDFRLTEAMATVARLCAHGRLNSIGQREKATRPRPGGKSPFTRVIEDYLRRFPGALRGRYTRARSGGTQWGGLLSLARPNHLYQLGWSPSPTNFEYSCNVVQTADESSEGIKFLNPYGLAFKTHGMTRLVINFQAEASHVCDNSQRS